ncbi:MAG: J domain-containing protein [Desulfobacteraceae bacterium]|nr:J domain-containing protein [Desulfobacteraceae bacterium]
MNRKTAYEILGLESGASLAQAKKAFRDLAKQYHPDLSFNDKIGGVQAEVRMNKMKQINRAFHFIAPLLVSIDPLPGKIAKDNPPLFKGRQTWRKIYGLLLDILRMLKKGLKLKFHRKVVKPPRPFVKPSPRSKVRRKNRPERVARFATILDVLHPGAFAGKKNKGCGRNEKSYSRDFRPHPRDYRPYPYANFIKYMTLKNQIDARTSRGEQNHGRIEKIQPVFRVDCPGDKKKS